MIVGLSRGSEEADQHTVQCVISFMDQLYAQRVEFRTDGSPDIWWPCSAQYKQSVRGGAWRRF